MSFYGQPQSCPASRSRVQVPICRNIDLLVASRDFFRKRATEANGDRSAPTLRQADDRGGGGDRPGIATR